VVVIPRAARAQALGSCDIPNNGNPEALRAEQDYHARMVREFLDLGEPSNPRVRSALSFHRQRLKLAQQRLRNLSKNETTRKA
jgi:hypothetical protein